MSCIKNIVVHEITSKDIKISGKASYNLLSGPISSFRVNFKGNIELKTGVQIEFHSIRCVFTGHGISSNRNKQKNFHYASFLQLPKN